MKDTTHPWLDDWEELDEIGRGGQGVVTEVREKEGQNRRGVLKRIVPRWSNDRQARQRLQQEAETLLTLHQLGARVPLVYDSFLNRDTAEPFLLMEFIEGIRFDEWLKTRAPIAPAKAVIITRGVAETLRLCHEHNIGHRDIKPSNIILQNGEISAPYILDFGIAFDSRQSVILTRDGEMFWNEFIVLPECQDLGGGHRDFRSDITALAGLFFSCLTGKPPIVLRDAQDLAPHQRHEKLLLETAETVEQGERFMWFFDRAFAYRIAERFQSLDEFIGQLSRFAASASVETLDLLEQFDILDQAVRSTDRNVQVGLLREKYNQVRHTVDQQLQQQMGQLKKRGAQPQTVNIRVDSMSEDNKPRVPDGDLLDDIRNVRGFVLARQHFQSVAVALIVGFGVGLQIHFYATSYIAPASKHGSPDKALEWDKIAAIDENTEPQADAKVAVIIDALKSRLAREVRNLARQKNEMT